MRTLPRHLAAATAVLALLPATAAGQARPEGDYSGQNGRFVLSVSGRTIDLVAFDFRCRATIGRTSLTSIRIQKRRGRWRFSILTYGLVTYRDDTPDENARIRISGTFSRSARRVTGRFVLRSPHCGSTGRVQWAARR